MYKKDFDNWNERKKTIHALAINPPYHPGEVWWCHLGVNIGFEEDGTGENSERPVVIVKRFNPSLCWVIPLSTSVKSNPYYVSVGSVDSKPASAIISQMRPVDTKRMINLIGLMDKGVFYKLKQAAKGLL